METTFLIQEAGFGFIGWLVLFAAFFFLKDAFGKKDNKKKDDTPNDNNNAKT